MGIGLTDILVALGNFPLMEDISLLGGFRTVADQTARDAIDPTNRKVGMFVWVESDLKLYRLGTGLSNGDWVEVTLSGGGAPSFLVLDTQAAESGNVYNSFGSVIAAANAIGIVKVLVVDHTLTVSSGTYDLKGITFISTGLVSEINFDGTASLTSLPDALYGIDLVNDLSSGVLCTLQDNARVELFRASSIRNSVSATSTFIDLNYAELTLKCDITCYLSGSWSDPLVLGEGSLRIECDSPTNLLDINIVDNTDTIIYVSAYITEDGNLPTTLLNAFPQSEVELYSNTAMITLPAPDGANSKEIVIRTGDGGENGGSSGSISISSGQGGYGGGYGGPITIEAGPGGEDDGASGAGSGGDLFISSGVGGHDSGSGAGSGGYVVIGAGYGGDADVNDAGNGGSVIIAAGNGGEGSGTGLGGNGGFIILKPGGTGSDNGAGNQAPGAIMIDPPDGADPMIPYQTTSMMFFDLESKFVAFMAPNSLTQPAVYVLPDSTGNNGDVLTLVNTSTGELAWAPGTGGPWDAVINVTQRVDDNSPVTVHTYTLDSESDVGYRATIMYEVNAIAIGSGGNRYANFKISATFERHQDTITEREVVFLNGPVRSDPDYDVLFDINGLDISIQVKGTDFGDGLNWRVTGFISIVDYVFGEA